MLDYKKMIIMGIIGIIMLIILFCMISRLYNLLIGKKNKPIINITINDIPDIYRGASLGFCIFGWCVYGPLFGLFAWSLDYGFAFGFFKIGLPFGVLKGALIWRNIRDIDNERI